MPQQLQPGDYYINEAGLLTFTETYHKRRGYCCTNGCKHCPWKKETMAEFCKQCSEQVLGISDNDFEGMTTPEQTAAKEFTSVLCEGCGDALVDHTGKCVSRSCDRKHGTLGV